MFKVFVLFAILVTPDENIGLKHDSHRTIEPVFPISVNVVLFVDEQ